MRALGIGFDAIREHSVGSATIQMIMRYPTT